MPCTVTQEEKNYYRNLERKEKKAKQANLEQMLCYAMTCYQSGQNFIRCCNDNEALRLWWNNHQDEDRKRIAKETVSKKVAEVRKNAIAKLTPQERAALGLNESFK